VSGGFRGKLAHADDFQEIPVLGILESFREEVVGVFIKWASPIVQSAFCA